MKKIKKIRSVIPLEELVGMSSSELDIYFEKVLRGYKKKQPFIQKRLRIKGKEDESFLLDNYDLEETIKTFKMKLERAKKSSDFSESLQWHYESFVPYAQIAQSNKYTYVDNVTIERANEYMRAILSKGNENDNIMLSRIAHSFQPKDWRKFFQSSYFQQAYINGSDTQTSSDLQEYIENDADNYSPWVGRLVEFARVNNISLVSEK